ncbi:MAG TPA: hypothetical protein VK689_13265 [Armatimonadota bacterium]|nr:hypothetical protein [Armatimonadota bacterium]
MGLSFTVGNAASAFIEPFASQIEQELRAQLSAPLPVPAQADQEPYVSDEVAWSGWKRLQEAAVQALGEDQVPHLLAMEAWRGVYLPVLLEPRAVQIGNHPTPLECASLPRLLGELEAFAASRALPTDGAGLESLWEHYVDNDDLIDEDFDVQTYTQLMLSAQVASKRRQPLWIVK